MIWRLDRLGRSLKDLIGWAQYLEANGIALKSLQEAIDTSTPAGKLVFHMFGALAEFERNLIKEQTEAGLAAARACEKGDGRAAWGRTSAGWWCSSIRARSIRSNRFRT